MKFRLFSRPLLAALLGGILLAAGSACAASLATIGVTGAALANYQSPENNLSNDQRGFIVGADIPFDSKIHEVGV